MYFNSIKTFIVAAVFAVCATASLGSASASTLDANKTVFGPAGGTISPTVTSTTPDSGDRYVVIRVNGAGPLFYVKPGGTSVTTTPTPFAAGSTFPAGTSTPLFNVNSLGLAPGTYQVAEVDTDAGADPLDASKWHQSLKAKNFSVGQPTTVNGDFDGDGFPDDDADKNGFHDDDRNFDTFHDDDLNKNGFHDDDDSAAQLNGTPQTGFHPDDKNHTGYHPDDAITKTGFHPDDKAHTGFHPNDKDHDGFADDDLNGDGFHDNDSDHNGFDDSDSNHDGFVDGNDDGGPDIN